VVPVPTPDVQTAPTPGIYTIPATTITLTESTTVCAATSTNLPSGTHTYGGVTTVVATHTTVVCPVATVTENNGVKTSTIVHTTYVCPSAGTYTIGATTTAVTEISTAFVYPIPTSYAPGTYTHPEIVTTITETNFVYFCPYTSSSIELPPPAATPPPKAQPKVAPAPKPSPIQKPSGHLGTDGDHWAITYTPYTSTGGCKGAAEVSSDIAEIASKGFTTIRLYSADKTDCNGLENVSAACKANGLTMIIGVFIKNTGLPGAQPQIDELAHFTRWEIVDLVVVGNEAVFSGFVGAQDLANFIAGAKQTFAGCGYTGPVTTTEPLHTLQENAAVLCPVIDVVGCNIHPFFNADVSASTAGEFVAGQLALVDKLCPGKEGINLETGWPSAGRCNGNACPGHQEQATAVAGIKAAVGGKSVMFSYINDEWKEPGPYECERSWGIAGLF
jgi:exo-beta-1,3-glucanase (GH17 family)